MDEFDPKEPVEADRPSVETTVVEELPEGDDDAEALDEGDGETEAVASEGGSVPGEPSRKRRRRRRRRGRSKAAGSEGAPGAESSGEGAPRRELAPQAAPPVTVRGLVKLHGDHSGLVVSPETFFAEKGDPFLPKYLVEGEDLEDGLLIEAEALVRGPKGPMVQKILSIEGMTPAEYRSKYVQFHKGISIDPNRRLRMETSADENSGRVLDLVVPLGRGQRCLIVAPPKAGKTFLLKTMANAIAKNDPDVIIFMLLVDERPEEVTDMQRGITGQVIASSADMNAAHHIAVAEATFERAKRLVEIGKDVVIFCDSLTRMSRAYNNEQRGSGKILSGGIDARTMEKPRRFFGGARNHEDGGSLTIIATCLVDTGSRMDDVIFEEFKGTGNCEIILDRGLFDRRVFPCINIPASGTRKEEKLYTAEELPKIHKLRRALSSVKPMDAMELLLSKLTRTKTNAEFLKSIA
ncbi:MAG TPA: transcription termination factor Rho [Thermoanaerobaculia bacterium]|nr:transcription termination factor Rho [Thermoanaerobaculia bacterium]HQN06758.1 transcription termination factor Rho [Thermoanaerobaculia bacterium]HQP85323.1 transcription termination factor Rho [Thermoanaerobaculia bacterium]